MTAFIDQYRDDYGVELICRTLEVSASAYYQRSSGQRSARAVEDDRLAAVIRQVHHDNYDCYGQIRMHRELLRLGEGAGRDQVARLMRREGLRGAKRRGKRWNTTTPDPDAQRAADLVKRDFSAEAPDRLWVSDFTYLSCWEGRAYWSFVLDVYSRMIVGWQLSARMRTDLVLDALRMALGSRQPGADVLIAHSDAGSQYTSYDYAQVLDDHRVLASIGTVGDAYDNAMAESLVDTFKTELIDDRVWRSRLHLELEIARWVHWYNTRRLHSSIGYIPPVEHEANWHAAPEMPERRPGPDHRSPSSAVMVYEPSGLVSATQ